MKTLAIIANLALLGIIGLMLATGDFVIDAEYILPSLLIVTTPILSLVALVLRGAGSNDWLSRYFERKALEERRRVELFRLQTGQPSVAPKGGPRAPGADSGVPSGPPSVR